MMNGLRNKMKEYLIEYQTKQGDKKKQYVTASDVRTAINNALELYTDIGRVTSARPKPMFDD